MEELIVLTYIIGHAYLSDFTLQKFLVQKKKLIIQRIQNGINIG